MSDKFTPSLESITIKAKYSIPLTSFYEMKKQILEYIKSYPATWQVLSEIGDSLVLFEKTPEVDIVKYLNQRRAGIPIYFSIIALEYFPTSILVEVECRPVMWYKICRLNQDSFTENQVQEALLETASFVKQVISIFKAKEVEPVSVYPIIERTEIKSRLGNLGLENVVGHLNKAEKHITQNNFEESLKSSRTAFEKTIDWQMKKRGLEKTDNYKNDLERLRSKGYLDKDTTQLLQSYYHCLSSIGVHAKGEIEAGIYEAQMGYRITLVMIDYLVSKLP